MKTVAIKLTSAIGINGDLYRAGSIVEVSDEAAKNLLHRGKGELATAEDEPEAEAEEVTEAKTETKAEKKAREKAEAAAAAGQ
jgi:hypothetical protein